MKAHFAIMLITLSILSSISTSQVLGHHDGVPAFLGVWSPLKNSNRVIDTSIVSGNLSMTLNVTDAHRAGTSGLSSFDIILTYDTARLALIAAGIANFPLSASLPAGARLEPLCGDGVIAGTVPSAGSSIEDTDPKIKFVDLLVSNNLWDNKFPPTRSNPEFVVYDNDGDSLYDTGELVMAGAAGAPSAGTALEDDPKIKYVDSNNDNVWSGTGEAIIYDSDSDSLYDDGCIFDLQRRTITANNVELECRLVGTVCNAAPGRSRIKVTLTGSPNTPDTGVALKLRFQVKAGTGSTPITMANNATITAGVSQIRYVKIDGFFQNSAGGKDYKAAVQCLTPSCPSTTMARVQPLQSATATVTISGVVGTTEAVTLGYRVVSPISPSPEFPTADPTVGVSFSPPSGTPSGAPLSFTSTMTVTTTLNTVRRDVGVSGIHTIIVNATSASITKGVITSFQLLVEFDSLDFGVSLSRNTVILRPGENTPEVRFIDSDLDGLYDQGEPLILDSNLNALSDTEDRIVSVTPHRPPTLFRFIDVDADTAFSPALEEFVVYDSNSNGQYQCGSFLCEAVIAGAAPPNNTALSDDAKIKYVDVVTLSDDPKLKFFDGLVIVQGIGVGAGTYATLLKDDVKIKYRDADADATATCCWDSGELVFYDVNTNNVFDAGTDIVIAGVSPGSGAVEDDPKVKYIDQDPVGATNPNNVWDSNESVIYDEPITPNAWNAGEIAVWDNDADGRFDSGEIVVAVDGRTLQGPPDGAPLKEDVKVKYQDFDFSSVWTQFPEEPVVYDTNSNNQFDGGDLAVKGTPSPTGVRTTGEPVTYDTDSDSIYDSGEPVIDGVPPAAGTALADDAKIKYHDFNGNSVRDRRGEVIVLDSNADNVVDASDTVVGLSGTTGAAPPRAPVASELGQALSEITGAGRLSFFDSIAGGLYNLGEKLVLDANLDGAISVSDTVVNGTAPRAPTGPELGQALRAELNQPLKTVGEIGQPLLTDSRIKFIDNTTANGVYQFGETLVFDADSSGTVTAGDKIVSRSPPVDPSAADLTKALVAFPTTGPRVKFIDLGLPAGYNVGETLVYDSQPDGVVDPLDTVVSASQRSPIPRVKFIDALPGATVDVGRFNAGETLVFDADHDGVVDAADTVVSESPTRAPNAGEQATPPARFLEVEIVATITWVSGGPESVSLVPQQSYPLDSTILLEAQRTSGLVSGPHVAGLETSKHISTVRIKTQDTTPSIGGGAMPAAFLIGFDAESAINGLSKNTNLTLVVAPLGYRWDLPFIGDYGLTTTLVSGSSPAAASGTRIQLDKGQSVMVKVTLSYGVGTITQGIPMVTLSTISVHPTILTTILENRTLFLWLPGYDQTNVTISTTASTPSVQGGYTIVTGAPTGTSPADESLKLCVLFQGDVNNDGAVNFIDLGRIGASFLKATGDPGFDPEADVNNDGAVNFLDLGIVGSEFLKSC